MIDTELQKLNDALSVLADTINKEVTATPVVGLALVREDLAGGKIRSVKVLSRKEYEQRI